MMFGRSRSHKQETLPKGNRYASTPLQAPGNMYTNRRQEEVDADGDLDELIQQEIQRYEELFHSNNNNPSALADDDTLMDGSIYTSIQASSAMLPTVNRAVSQDQDEEDTMWGLDTPALPAALRMAPTALLKPEETAAARACMATKPKSVRKQPATATQVDAVKPKPAPPVVAKKTAMTTPMSTTKKSRFKVFPKRLLGKSSGSGSNKNSNTAVSSTPQTQASTPANSSTAPKMKFFSPVKFLKPSKSAKAQQKSQQQPHQNLHLASFVAGKQNHQEPTKRALATTLPPPTSNHNQDKPVNRTIGGMPPPPPSPPPPIDTIDGNSVISAQSSLTDALDAWFVKSSPPKIIGGSPPQDESPYKMDAYEGGLTPYLDTPEEANTNNDEEEASAASPGALNLTEEGLYFHNNHGKALSPIRVPRSTEKEMDGVDNAQDSLVQMVRADKEQRERLNESRTTAHDEASPEDSDNMQVVKILGLRDSGTGQEDRSNNVKRDLFGANKGADDAHLDVSLAPLQQVVSPTKEDQGAISPVQPVEDTPEVQAPKSVQPQPQKPSKFKKFLNKLVSNPKVKQAQQEAQAQKLLEQARAKAHQAELEKQRLDEAETKRIEQKRQQELERQRKLELGSQNPASNTGSTDESATSDANSAEGCPARTFSLMSGQMKADEQPGSQSSTADVTSHPTVQSALSSLSPSILETPRTTGCPTDGMLIPATPSSSYLVNFQFHRRSGDKTYSMAYSVDSANENVQWKDIVNQAWKEDRKVVKSGVFSAIAVDSIAKIQAGSLEMRFELPFWGKHASQTMGAKTLDLVLDVVGPQRPVQVTITLEEPQVAAGVDDDDSAPDGLF